MIFLSCYDTTAMTGFPQDKVDKILRTALAAGALRSFDGKPVSMNAVSLDPIEDAYMIEDAKNQYFENLPSLKHPYILTDDKTKRTSLIMDARTMVVEDKVNQGFILRGGSRVDLNMLTMRVGLERLWLDERQVEIRSASAVPAIIFARWISSTLAQRYMLDPRDQETIEIIAAYYYYHLFTNNGQDDQDKIVGYFSRHLGMQAERSYEVIGQITREMKNVQDLCSMFEEVTGSIRLKDFNPGHLFTSLGMSYFGMTGKELTAIALEHPPTWIVMLSYAVNDAMYRKSAIGNMMERGTMKQKSKDFVMAIDQMLYTYNH